MATRTTARLVASGVAALALVALAGCQTGTVSSGEPTPATSTAQPSGQAVESEGPSPSATEPASSASRSPATEPPPPTKRRTLRQRLLTAGQVPGINDQLTWRVKSTRSGEGAQPFGTCQRFDMASIGAVRVVVREYVPATQSPGTSAGNLVATFADVETARRAFEVLRSWRSKCLEDQLGGHEYAEVGKLRLVRVSPSGADGNWYLLNYGPAAEDHDSGYFDAQGFTRVGRTISALEMRLVGQDHNYPAGEEPMVAAVQAAADKLR